MVSGSGSAASTVPPSYPVGRGIFLPSDQLPSGQFLSRCEKCDCRALIARTGLSDFYKNGVLCLDHGLDVKSVTRDLAIRNEANPGRVRFRYNFISPEHEAAILAVLA